MMYSLVGLLSLMLLAIMDAELWFRPKSYSHFPGLRSYRLFLVAISLYFVADLAWGILYDANLVSLVSVDTSIYFLTMGASVFTWTLFLTRYLPEDKTYGRALLTLGSIIFLASVTLIIINFSYPVFFRFDEAKVYHAMPGRYAFFSAQLLMFVLAMITSFIAAIKVKGSLRRRYFATAGFSLALFLGIFVQILLPLYPCYAVGALIGLTLMHTLVLTGEKAESLAELGRAKEINDHDALTGVLSRYAYVQEEEKMDQRINHGSIDRFALVVFDLNNLKNVNDNYGHEAGDRYIIRSAKLIQEHFAGASLFRFGGDEFVAVLEGDLYERRHEILAKFEKVILTNIPKGEVSIATGISDFKKEEDNTFRAVFIRADKEMYRKKAELKGGS